MRQRRCAGHAVGAESGAEKLGFATSVLLRMSNVCTVQSSVWTMTDRLCPLVEFVPLLVNYSC
jgi:hypothetical protein